MIDDPMLSIYVATYNHEKYIVKALESILMQKTKYSYEVLIGEDCSTDNTRAILKEYEKKLPSNFTIFYREKNMSKLEIGNTMDLKLRCRGKYIIALEGDDFWIDELKIEKQIDFLETHPDYVAVAHNCIVVDADSVPNGEKYPECTDNEYTLRHYACDIFPGQLTTVMSHNYMLGDCFDNSLCLKRTVAGDRSIYFSLIANGKVYCMQEVMSAYRHIVKGGTSFSATYKYDFNEREKWHMDLVTYAYSINNNEAILIAEFLYSKNIFYAAVKKYIKNKEVNNYLKIIKHKFKVMLLLCKLVISKKILHKKLYL